jgi:hypothetical protein
MRVSAIGVEHALDVPIQCPHDANTCKHRWAARLSDQDQGFHRGLPFGGLMLGFRKPRDEFAGILKSDKPPTARQRDRIVELTVPAKSLTGASCFDIVSGVGCPPDKLSKLQRASPLRISGAASMANALIVRKDQLPRPTKSISAAQKPRL